MTLIPYSHVPLIDRLTKMPFKPIAILVKTLRGWLHPKPTVSSSGCDRVGLGGVDSTFRRLEKRRVFAVDAFFGGGALEIAITNLGETNANLLADGTDFFVDNNNNLAFEMGEVRGAIADLQSVFAYSNDSVGKLLWSGDFSLAPLSAPISANEVVRTEALEEVNLQADFIANGSVSLNVLDSLQFNADINVQGDLHASVSQAGFILDGPNARLTITGDAVLQSPSSIILADEASTSWSVAGSAIVEAQGDVRLGLLGAWDSESLRASGDNISVLDQSGVVIDGVQAEGNLDLRALGIVTDATGTSIQVVGSATIHGTSVELANDAADFLHIRGSVSLNATGGSVEIGNLGDVRLGDISASGTSVALFEDTDMTLASIQTPGHLLANSSGSMDDTARAVIQASSMNLVARDSVLLANDSSDEISVTGRTYITANNRVDILSPGLVNFGSIGISAGNAVIHEDSGIQLDGSILRELELHARGSVTQSGVDTGAGASILRTSGPVHVALLDSPGTIDLYRASSNPPNAISDGRLLDNQIEGTFTAEGIDGDFRLRNASTLASIGTILGSFDDFTLWHTQSSIVLPIQDFNVRGDLELIAGVDVSNPFSHFSNPIDRILNTNASIFDSGSRLIVAGDANFVAAANVTMGSSAGEILSVTTGATSVISLGGGEINLGPAGNVLLAELGLYSKSLLDGRLGDAIVQLDRSVALINPMMPDPDGSQSGIVVQNLTLNVNGNLSNVSGTDVLVTGDLDAFASGSIRLADHADDSLRISGDSTLTARSGSIELGRSGTVLTSDANFSALNGFVVIGGLGRTELGTLEVRGLDVSVQEDTSMVIRAAVATNRLTLASDSSILNTVAFVSDGTPNGTFGISAATLSVESGSFAHLGKVSVDRLEAIVHSNGTLVDGSLFMLNPIANETGQRYLDTIGQNLPPNVSPSGNLLSGETIDELRRQSSFVESFQRQYGLFVDNNKTLIVDEIVARGDGVQIYVESAVGSNLVVAGQVLLQYTGQETGGLVFIAGDQLIVNANAELRVEQISQDVSTSRVVKQSGLVASAFDGGQGPAGYESTRDVLYASDAFADSRTQNVHQRVSAQFGVNGESGFQTLIRYADGSSQLFDTNEELKLSLQSNPNANSRAGVVPAFVSSAGDAAVVERNAPFADAFLGTVQTMPTTAYFRRSFEFFLFEQSGTEDSSIVKLDLTPVEDRVDEVFSPGRKISFPLPTEIIVNPAILVAPIRLLPETVNSYSNLSSDIEPSLLNDATFEVFIVNVGFEDANRDGQVSDPELPNRNEIRIETVVTKSKSNQPDQNPNENIPIQRPALAPGEPNVATKDVKGSTAPNATEIEEWIEEYRDSPTKPSGAYAIISVDSVSGAKVLKVFGVRDFEVQEPTQDTNNDSTMEKETNQDAEQANPVEATDKTSFSVPNFSNSNTMPHWMEEDKTVTGFEMGIAAGALWTSSNSQGIGNRFSRLARTLRALRRDHSESDHV